VNLFVKRKILFLSLFLVCGCPQRNITVNSQSTSVEPLPIKVGGFKDSGIEIAIPAKIEKKKTGGFRSPVEIRFKVLLTNWDTVNIPVRPTGFVFGPRVRW